MSKDQADYLQESLESQEREAEKWAKVCREEGHRWDSVGICGVCGVQIPDVECDCAGDELATGAHFSNCAFLRAKFNY